MHHTEGLHLIDFEQLKIENQSLNEKIVERNEELVKLRKKTTITVQVGAGERGATWCTDGSDVQTPSALSMQCVHAGWRHGRLGRNVVRLVGRELWRGVLSLSTCCVNSPAHACIGRS
jgi:hypothetical protein